jgi:hypothetical protein
VREIEVGIPLKLLLQARFATEGTALCALIDKAIDKAAKLTTKKDNGNVIKQLRKIATDHSVGEILPFELNALDLNIACLLLRDISFGTYDEPEGIIFGNSSRVNAGFALVQNENIEYFDTWVEPPRTFWKKKSPIEVCLKPTNRQRFIDEVRALCDFKPMAVTASGEEPAIIIFHETWVTPADRKISEYSVDCHLLDPRATSSSRSQLSGIRVTFLKDKNAFCLTPTKPETLIQLSAAYQQKRWFELTIGAFRALFVIPDISEEGHSAPAWVFRLVDDESYVYSSNTNEINVPLEVALQCCEAFRWFVIADNFAMARRLSTKAVDKIGIPI